MSTVPFIGAIFRVPRIPNADGLSGFHPIHCEDSLAVFRCPWNPRQVPMCHGATFQIGWHFCAAMDRVIGSSYLQFGGPLLIAVHAGMWAVTKSRLRSL